MKLSDNEKANSNISSDNENSDNKEEIKIMNEINDYTTDDYYNKVINGINNININSNIENDLKSLLNRKPTKRKNDYEDNEDEIRKRNNSNNKKKFKKNIFIRKNKYFIY